MFTHSQLPHRLSKQFEEMYSLPPNDLHNSFLTAVYKFFTRPLKHMPFAIIIPVSFFLTVAAYLLLGTLLIKLVSLLQHGF